MTRFLFGLVLLSIISLSVGYTVFDALLKIEYGTLHYISVAYFAIIVLMIQMAINRSLKNRPQQFVWVFMASLGVKMFLSLLILLVVIFMEVAQPKAFGIHFISLYFVFSTYSVWQIMKAQRRSLNKSPQE